MPAKTTKKNKKGTSSVSKQILIIVESPTKARTINGFINNEYQIESSYGHIRDLPKSKLGIDVENTFDPQYVIPTKARKRVNELKKKALNASKVILATDEDREGEAIAWHLLEALELNNKQYERIVFHEITSEAINQALLNPRKISFDLVHAQQARRLLDRLVGYKLSPFLWKKVMGGLSAGRVQSVTVRLIVERENEIRKFIPETYYTIKGLFKSEEESFEASLIKIEGKAIPKPGIKDESYADQILNDIRNLKNYVISVEEKKVFRSPNPPFTTSSLQQEAAKKLGFSSKLTMMIAQKLYEKGHITYMRTDSLNLSATSLSSAREWMLLNLGRDYITASPRIWKTKSKSAQEAHEAIRPTNLNLKTESLNDDIKSQKLYDLIFKRFIASQMPDAIFLNKRALIGTDLNKYILSASGSSLLFDGYLKVWPSKFEESTIPNLQKDIVLNVLDVIKEKHETEPPARYNEASLIKTLEELGIGRPSTYAPTISLIQTRQYVEKNTQKRFVPTDIGEKINQLLMEHFPNIVDIGFTAEIENKLDTVASGKSEWKKIIKDFYIPFAEILVKKYDEVEKENMDEETDEKCDKCNRKMIIKRGRFGRFIACSGFPECKNTKKIAPMILKTELGEEISCSKCITGKIIAKKTKRGRLFYGCNRYPDCDFASWQKPIK